MSGVILLKGCTDAFSPKVVRAAMGSLFYLPLVAEVSREDFFRFAGVERLRLYATALDAAAEPHFAADYTGATGIVFGNSGVSGRVSLLMMWLAKASVLSRFVG